MVDPIRLDQVALDRVEAASRELRAANSREGLRAFGEVADKVEAAIEKVIARVQDVATFAGLDPDQTRDLRRGLEAVDGGLDGVKGVLPYALSRGGAAGFAIAGGAAVLGALNGASRESVRRIQRLAEMADRDQFDALDATIKERFDEIDRRHAERRAAFRRGRRPR